MICQQKKGKMLSKLRKEHILVNICEKGIISEEII
jgi:hypothetical protein